MRTWSSSLLGCAALVVAVACGNEIIVQRPDDDGTTTDTVTTSTVTTGTVTTGTTGTTTGTTGTTGTTTTPLTCFDQPDYYACANCLCSQNNAGCLEYIVLLDEHYYCGMTCGMACDGYCQSGPPGNKDPGQIDMVCEDCLEAMPAGSPDVDAFLSACQLEPTCVTFVQDLQMCPE